MYDACMTRSTQVDIGGWIKMGHAACVIFKTRRRINQKLAVSHVLQINAPLPLSIWRNTHSLFANLFIFSRTPPLNIAAPSFRGFHLRNSNTFPWLKNLARSFFFFSFPENILHCNYRRWTRFLLNIFHASKRHLNVFFRPHFHDFIFVRDWSIRKGFETKIWLYYQKIPSNLPHNFSYRFLL